MTLHTAECVHFPSLQRPDTVWRRGETERDEARDRSLPGHSAGTGRDLSPSHCALSSASGPLAGLAPRQSNLIPHSQPRQDSDKGQADLDMISRLVGCPLLTPALATRRAEGLALRMGKTLYCRLRRGSVGTVSRLALKTSGGPTGTSRYCTLVQAEPFSFRTWQGDARLSRRDPGEERHVSLGQTGL